jgi:hypothetical protein
MPVMEVIHAAEEPATTDQKRAFVRSAVEIFRDVLGTPDGKLRVFFYQLDALDGIDGLLKSGDDEDAGG